MSIYRKETFSFFFLLAKRAIYRSSLGLFVLISVQTAFAQAIDSATQDQLDEIDLRYYYRAPDSALLLYSRVADAALDHGQYDLYLDAYLRMAWCAVQHARIDDFRSFLSQAEEISRQYQPALDTLDATHTLRANIPYTWGLYYETTRDYFKAIDTFRPIIATPHQYEDSLLVSDTYYELGLCHHALENYRQAIVYRQLALQWLPSDALQEQLPYHQALLYLSIGTSFDLQASHQADSIKAQQAKRFYDTSLRLLLDYDHPDHAREAIISNYHHLGRWHLDREQYDSALWQLNQAAHWYDSQVDRTDVLLLRGDIYLAKQDDQRAYESYQRAARVVTEFYGDNKVEKATIAHRIGKVFLVRHQLDSALSYFQQSIIQQTDGFDTTSITRNPSIEQINFTKESVEAFSSKAEVLYQKSREAPEDTASLLLALDTYHLLVGILDKMRQTFPSLEYKQFISSKAASLYEQAVRASLRAHEIGLTQRDFLAEAFYFSEKGKATTLLEAVKTHEARSFASIPAELLERENRLKRELTYWENELYQAEDDSAQQALRSQTFIIREQYNALVNQLEQEYPRYHQLKYDTEVVGLASLQATLPTGTALLSFTYGDSTLYAFTVRQDTVLYHTIRQDDTFRRSLAYVLHTISQYDYTRVSDTQYFEQFSGAAHSLYQTLVQPSLASSRSSVERLVIIPDGTLGYLPFDVLLTDASVPTRVDYRELSYLVKQLPVSYEYSATLLTGALPPTQDVAYPYLGFAPTYPEAPLAESREVRTTLDGTLLGLGQLRYNHEEVAYAANLFQGKALVDQEATETQFKQQAGRSKLLHLSMHAYAHDRNDDFSGLIFTQQADREREDGFLHANELYSLSLNAELAVLSACETGIGTLAPGEGIMSLGRAFKYAGCPNVTMSLWNADDQSTNRIMQRFFAHLHQGIGKDDALRKAKLEYLGQAQSAQAHPYYWAAFVQVGSNAPLSSESFLSTWGWVMGGVALLILAVGLFIFRRYYSRTR